MIGIPLFVLAAPAMADSLIRALLAVQAGEAGPPRPAFLPQRWVVLIPAREEGEHLRPTLESIGHGARIVVILDGADPVAERIARDAGAEVHVKQPAGPTKAAALAWAAEHVVLDCDAILLLDVGSRLEPGFFDRFAWKRGSDAMQAFLSGSGGAAAVSERVAQRSEDTGRERLGWAVRLRGSGTAFTPEVFRSLMPRLRTQVEDLEASLLLAAEGRTLTMGPRDAVVLDEKPGDVGASAVQRSRWLAGKMQVLTHHSGALAELARRNPAEGFALACEILGRPLSLSALLRIGAAAALAHEKRYLLASIAAATVAGDVVLHARAGASPAETGRIIGAWMGAAAMAPRALARWMKARGR